MVYCTTRYFIRERAHVSPYPPIVSAIVRLVYCVTSRARNGIIMLAPTRIAASTIRVRALIPNRSRATPVARPADDHVGRRVICRRHDLFARRVTAAGRCR